MVGAGAGVAGTRLDPPTFIGKVGTRRSIPSSSQVGTVGSSSSQSSIGPHTGPPEIAPVAGLMFIRASARVANTTETRAKAIRAWNVTETVFAALKVQMDHTLMCAFVLVVDRKLFMISPKWLLDHQRMSVGLAAIWADRAYRTSANALVYRRNDIFGERLLNPLVLSHNCVKDDQRSVVATMRATTSTRNGTSSSGSCVISMSLSTSEKAPTIALRS